MTETISLTKTEMQASKMAIVNVADLQDLPVQTNHPSTKLVQMITEIAKTAPDSIAPILVGRVNSLLYPVNGFEIVEGLRRSETKKANAFVMDYSSMQDLIIAHVRKNFEPHTLDPFKLRQVISYLVEKHKMTLDDACESLWLSKRPILFQAVRCEIEDTAVQCMLDMAEEISEKIYSVTTPVYYLTKLAKITRAEQEKAAREIMAFTMSRMVSEKKSSWPNAETIDSILEGFKKGKKIPPVEDRVAEKGDYEDLKHKKKDDKKSPKSSTLKKAEKYIKEDPDLIYVPLEGKHPDLLLNKKTGRVAKAEEKNGLYSMVDDLGESTHALPHHIAKYLDLDNNEAIITKYETFEKACKALGKAKKQSRCVLISTSPIPKR